MVLGKMPAGFPPATINFVGVGAELALPWGLDFVGRTPQGQKGAQEGREGVGQGGIIMRDSKGRRGRTVCGKLTTHGSRNHRCRVAGGRKDGSGVRGWRAGN